MSLCWQTDVNSSNWIQGCHTIIDHCIELSTDELLFVYPVFIHRKGKLRYKYCFTFSVRPAEANCVPEKSPVETLSLRSRVERFSQSERKTTGAASPWLCAVWSARQSGHPVTVPEVSRKLTLCSQSFLKLRRRPDNSSSTRFKRG
ncbi:hypothetical protein ILYODFUR_033852 [Ilyodon furcidens]|uniref:Uncharacterized protein n=1 Tax=Ilyodon furcidens TaxID=33524 RepID=A0ABV0TST1_9TELE